MSDWTVGIKNEDDRRRIAGALDEMYRRMQEPPELPEDQRTLVPVTRQEFDIELAIFDLDGTLTETRSGETFPKNLHDRRPIRHTQAKIATLHELGIKVAVATNQGGVAYGYYKYDEMRNTISRQVQEWYDIPLWTVTMCPHHPKGTVPEFARECACRKPSPYMLLYLMERHYVAPSHTLFVGDMDSDKEAAERAGCHFLWARDYFSPKEWR